MKCNDFLGQLYNSEHAPFARPLVLRRNPLINVPIIRGRPTGGVNVIAVTGGLQWQEKVAIGQLRGAP